MKRVQAARSVAEKTINCQESGSPDNRSGCNWASIEYSLVKYISLEAGVYHVLLSSKKYEARSKMQVVESLWNLQFASCPYGTGVEISVAVSGAVDLASAVIAASNALVSSGIICSANSVTIGAGKRGCSTTVKSSAPYS